MVNSFNWVNRGQGFKSERVTSTTTIKPYATYSGSPGPASEQSWSRSVDIDRRGGHTVQSNLGINVPLMQVVDYADLVHPTLGTILNGITEVAVFVCSEVPSSWTEGLRFRKSGTGTTLDFDWASPSQIGRRILTGARVNYGNSRLTAIKLHK